MEGLTDFGFCNSANAPRSSEPVSDCKCFEHIVDSKWLSHLCHISASPMSGLTESTVSIWCTADHIGHVLAMRPRS